MDNQAKRIFLEALKHQPNSVADFVNGQCGDDLELREQVQTLLDAYQQDSELARRSRVDATAAHSDSRDPKLEPSIMPGTAAKASSFIGPYKLLQLIGEGGMGAVWMAEQEHPVKRRVALKLIRADMGSKEIVARFEAERQALAMMDHPNIARVLDAGTTEHGSPYFVMELVKGMPLNEFCDQHKLSIRERLELFVPICNAIQHAHQKGIIHRDLKPSNVLVTLQDSKPLPKVIDFGLAKALEHTHKLTDKTLFTEFGKVVGTLQYMSPEQAEMNVLDVDTRTDIYSLGVMLYELLAGSTPIEKQSLHNNPMLQVLAIIREVDPPMPSTRLSSSGNEAMGISALRKIAPAKLQQMLRGDLDWVVMKAIEKDRTRRYETANGFANDIHRFLDGEAVNAVPPSFNYRARKFVNRNRTAVIAAGLVLLTLLAGIAGTTWGLFEAVKQRKIAVSESAEKELARHAESQRAEGERLAKLDAEKQKAIAEETAEDLAVQKQEKADFLYVAHLNMIQQAWENGTPRRARELLDRYVPVLGSVDLRTFEWYYFDSLSRNCADIPTLNYGDKVICVAADPVSNRIAVAGDGNKIQIWNTSSNPKKLLELEGHQRTVMRLDFSPDGKFLVSCDWRSVQIWKRLASGFKSVFQQDILRPYRVRISSDGKYVAIPEGKAVVLVETDNLSTRRFDKHSKDVSDLRFSNDSQSLFSSSADGTIRRWNVESGAVDEPVVTVSTAIDAIEVSDDDQKLVFTYGDQLALKLLKEDAKEQPLGKLAGEAWALESLNNGKTFAVEMDDEIAFWSFENGKFVGRLNDPGKFNNGTSYSLDGTYFSTSGTANLVYVWASKSLDLVRAIRGHSNTIYGMAFSPAGGLATASRDGTAKIWDSIDPTNTLKLDSGRTRLWALSFSSDSRKLAVACEDSRVVIWDTETGQKLHELNDHTGSVQFVRFSPDGRLLASGGEDGVVRLWDVGDFKPIAELKDHANVVNSFDFSPDGKQLVSCSNGGIVIVWDIETRAIVMRYDAQSPADIWAVAFGRSGKSVVYGGMDKKISKWDFAAGKSPEAIRDVPDNVTSLTVSPNGLLASATIADGSVFVFEYDNPAVSFPLIAHSGDAMSSTFSPNGKTLVSGGSDGARIQFWNVKTREPTVSFPGDGLHHHSLLFSPNGKIIGAARWDGTVRLWKIESP